MICRRPLALAAVFAASIVVALAVVPGPTRAGSLTALDHPTAGDYVLTFPQGLSAPVDSASGPQVVISLPPGSVVPNSLDTHSPLLIDMSKYASGVLPFDASKLVVALKDVPASGTTAAQEYLGLAFAGQGILPGGSLQFQLNKPSASASDPTLTLVTPAPGANGPSLTQQLPAPPAPSTPAVTTPVITTTSTTAAATPPPTVTGPEPMSLALWSALTVAGFLRARAYRRRRAD